MRPPIFEPTRILRDSTVPEPWRALSRRNHPAYSPVAASATAAASKIRMSLRFMKLVSTGEERDGRHRRRIAARRQARPEQVERRLDSCMTGRSALKRHGQEG